MDNITNIPDDAQLYCGALFRLFEVKRFDVMKTESDHLDSEKRQKDFYDYMLIDANVIAKGSFLLVNVTINSDNRGSIAAVLSNNYDCRWIDGKIIKDFFNGQIAYRVH